MSACGYAWHPTLEPCMIVTLQGLEMHSSGRSIYGITAPIDGWANSGTSAGGPIPWGNADGGIMGDTHYAGRSLVIEGEIDAGDHAEYAEAVEALGGVLASPRTGILEVDETYHLGLVRQIEVTRTRPIQISQIGPTYGIFTMTLEAASFPRLGVDEQSATITTSGVTLTNHGNYPAELSGTLHGPTDGNAVLVHPGGHWKYVAQLKKGEARTVDFTRRIVKDLSTDRFSRIDASGEWPSVPPGTSTFQMFGTTTGHFDLSWRSSWA